MSDKFTFKVQTELTPASFGPTETSISHIVWAAVPRRSTHRKKGAVSCYCLALWDALNKTGGVDGAGRLDGGRELECTVGHVNKFFLAIGFLVSFLGSYKLPFGSLAHPQEDANSFGSVSLHHSTSSWEVPSVSPRSSPRPCVVRLCRAICGRSDACPARLFQPFRRMSHHISHRRTYCLGSGSLGSGAYQVTEDGGRLKTVILLTLVLYDSLHSVVCGPVPSSCVFAAWSKHALMSG